MREEVPPPSVVPPLLGSRVEDLIANNIFAVRSAVVFLVGMNI